MSSKYELAVLLDPDLEVDAEKAQGKIEKLLESSGAKILSSEPWGKRKLAYPIKKQDWALYLFYRLELNGAAVSELERVLSITNEVLRHLIVKIEPIKSKVKEQAKLKKGADEAVSATKSVIESQLVSKAVTKTEAEPAKSSLTNAIVKE